MPTVTDNGKAAVFEEDKSFGAVLGILSSLKTMVADICKTDAGAMLVEELDSLERHRQDMFRLGPV